MRQDSGPSWSSTLTKDQTVSLFKEAMTLLIEGGIKIEEMTRVAGLEARLSRLMQSRQIRIPNDRTQEFAKVSL
jgi:hypothetical protein